MSQDYEIEYRGERGLLFKRDYGSLYASLFPELALRHTEELTGEKDGFDRVTFHVLENVRSSRLNKRSTSKSHRRSRKYSARSRGAPWRTVHAWCHSTPVRPQAPASKSTESRHRG